MFDLLPINKADFQRRIKEGSGKWLTAYADADQDDSLFPTDQGLAHATVKDAHQAQVLLDLTDPERKELERTGRIYKDINGQPYQIDLF